MSKRQLPVAEVKATLSEQIRRAEGGNPVLITRHGKVVAALVPAEDVEVLERLRAAGPEGGLASVAGGWKGSDELVKLLQSSPRVGRRDSPTLD
jgi:prevent-host-death family protein